MLSKEWNKKGLIPGPEETEEEYNKRAKYCLNLSTELEKNTEVELPFKLTDQATQEIQMEALHLTENLYGISPTWIPLFFSNYQLSPWQAGCAWIFQMNENTPTAAFIQLRNQFKNSSEYLKFYKRKELIAHEISHVGRMMFHEPKFEEILAYQSSSNKWSRWFGPIVQSSKESLLFIMILGLIILADLILIGTGNAIVYKTVFLIKLVPIALIFYALIRLWRRQNTFHKCLKNLEIYGNHAKHIIYRLTDKEIEYFASSSPHDIQTYIENESSFRWQVIKDSYC